MTAPQARPSSRSARAVLWWTNIYTRSVLPEAASARREELLSDLHEQYAAGVQDGLSPKAISRSIVWRAIRGIPADLRWGNAHQNRKGKTVEAAALGNRRGKNPIRGMNWLWITLAAAFVVGLGATIAGYFVHTNVLGDVYVGPMGFSVAGLLVLASMAGFLLARLVQLVGQTWSDRRRRDL